MKARETTTIAAPRADWMLLRMHYLRVVAPLAAVCIGTELTLMAAATVVLRLRPIEHNPGPAYDNIAILLAMLVALPVGAAVYSRPFKEQHVVLFHALPVSRLRQWALFLTASLLALLTVYAALAILRPNAAAMVVQKNILTPFVIFTAISFAAGLCFALIFVRTFAVYLGAYIATLAVPVVLTLAIFAPTIAFNQIPRQASSMDIVGEIVSAPRDLPPGLMWITAALIVLVFTLASAFFYVRGEMTLPRVQARNFLLLTGSVFALALVAAPLIYGLAPGRRTTWGRMISPDGRVIAVWEKNTESSWDNDVRVTDLATGNSVAWKSPGLRGCMWTDRNELLTMIHDVSPLRRLFYLLPADDRIERWSARGAKLGEEKYPGEVFELASLSDNQLVAATREGDTAAVFALNNGVRGRELLRAAAPDATHMGRDLVLFEYYAAEPRLWRVTHQGAREIARVPVASERANPWVFDGMFYPEREPLLRKIEASWPAPRAAGDRVGYILWHDAPWVLAVVVNPSTSVGALHVMDVPTKQWKLLSNAIPFKPTEVPRDAISFYDLSTASSIHTGAQPGFVLFAERSGDRILHRLHDAHRGETVTFYERPAEDQRRFTMNMTLPVTPKDTLVLRVEADMHRVAELLWRDGRLTAMPVRDGTLIALWPDQTQVRRVETGLRVIHPNGTERLIEILEPK